MADALGLHVNRLIKHYEDSRMILGSSGNAMNRLREMMVGYEIEEVLALLEQMEDAVALYETLSSHVIEAPNAKRTKTEPVDGLMSYLRDMMVGYENEQVISLLKQMEGAVVTGERSLV